MRASLFRTSSRVRARRNGTATQQLTGVKSDRTGAPAAFNWLPRVGLHEIAQLGGTQ